MGMDLDYIAAKQAIEELDDFLSEQEHGEREEISDQIVEFVEKLKSGIKEPPTAYLILSGEGNIDTEHQFCMECTSLKDANKHFDNFKNQNIFKNTYLFIYKAQKIREE